MASFSHITHTPLQTRQAILILNPQNDFLSENGRLATINRATSWKRLSELIPIFRRHGDVYWIRTQNTVPRDDAPDLPPAADASPAPFAAPADSFQHADPELFLNPGRNDALCCDPRTTGFDYTPEAIELQAANDTHIVKTGYSALQDTPLLTLMRMRLTTEVYLVGSILNLCIHATASDVARHGMQINLVEDCLGYCSLDRHIQSMHSMTEVLGALVTTSATIMDRSSTGSARVDGSPECVPAPEPDVAYTIPDIDQHSLAYSGPTNDTDRNTLDAEYLQPDEQDNRVRTARSSDASAYHERSDEALYPRKGPLVPLPVPHISTPVQDLDAQTTVSDAATPSEGPQGTTTLAAEPTATQTPDVAVSEQDDLVITVAPVQETAILPDLPNLTVEDEPPHVPTAERKKRSSTDLGDDHDHVLDATPPLNQRSHEGSNKRAKTVPSLSTLPTKGPSDTIGLGDTTIRYDLFPADQADALFHDLLWTTPWQTMMHASGPVPRLVCCQGDIDPVDGSMPVYRHPSDGNLPLLHWSSSALQAREAAEREVGHPLNHVLIQLYRGGHDHISEHSDKTLDIAPGSKIVNVSLGAQRTMRLRTKRVQSSVLADKDEESTHSEHTPTPGQDGERITERAHLPHNSIFVLGRETNAKYLHGIQPDKRLAHDLTEPEMAFGGYRIGLTFRHIATFISHDSKQIWGQGATQKSKDQARNTINGEPEPSQDLITAFGTENQSSTDFYWHATYGDGFDVLNLKTPLPVTERVLFFKSGHQHDDAAMAMFLSSLGLPVEPIDPPDLPSAQSQRRQILLRDADTAHTHVTGLRPALLYLDRRHPRPDLAPAQLAREAQLLFGPALAPLATAGRDALAALERELGLLPALGGVLDCMAYPLAKALLDGGGGDGGAYPAVRAWLGRLEAGRDVHA